VSDTELKLSYINLIFIEFVADINSQYNPEVLLPVISSIVRNVYAFQQHSAHCVRGTGFSIFSKLLYNHIVV